MADIARRVMGGARYSDFAVVSRNADSYRDILSRAALAAKIPLFISTKRDVASFEAIKQLAEKTIS